MTPASDRYARHGLNEALVHAVHECERIDTEGNSWTGDEQDAAWTVARYLLALPTAERMEAMGMVAIEVVADDGEALDVWIERGDETDGGY